MNTHPKNILGFTILELLLILTIIGVLTFFTIGKINSIRSKARDSKTISDIKAIKTAVLLSKDETGKYPAGVLNASCLKSVSASGECFGDASVDVSLNAALKKYLPQFPKPPASFMSGGYTYLNESSGVIDEETGYEVIYTPPIIIYALENPFENKCQGWYLGSAFYPGYYFCYEFIKE